MEKEIVKVLRSINSNLYSIADSLKKLNLDPIADSWKKIVEDTQESEEVVDLNRLRKD